MELVNKAGQLLSEKKAKDITIIDISKKSSFADYFLIATGGSDRQIDTLADEVKKLMEKEGLEPKSVEGKSNSGWVLLDYGDIIVNIFNKEQRETYQLERIWGDGTITQVEE